MSALFQNFHAVYEDGVLKPLEPLLLAEHQRVWVSVAPEMSDTKDVADVVARQRQAMEELDEIMDALPDNSTENESFFEAASRLGFIGCIEGTPSDLSTNKKHMEGFGKRGS